MLVPSQEQRDYLASLDSLLTRADPLTAMPNEPADRTFDMALWRDLASMGALTFLAADPGERDPATAVLVSECLGRYVAPVPFFSSAVLASAFLSALPATEATTSLLAALVDGSRVATVGLIGADGLLSTGTQVRAARSDGRWVLTGRLPFVPDADIADRIVTVAATPVGAMPFLVDLAAPGVTRQPLVSLDQTQPFAAVTFDQVVGVPAPASDDQLAEALSTTRLIGIGALTAALVGTAEQLLTMSVEYAGQRVQFGRAIGSRQAIKHKCADMVMLVESARSAVYHLADLLSAAADARSVALAASLAKSYCSEAAMTCASEALQIHGGIGFTWEHPLHRYFKRCTTGASLLGDASHHNAAILSLLEGA